MEWPKKVVWESGKYRIVAVLARFSKSQCEYVWKLEFEKASHDVMGNAKWDTAGAETAAEALTHCVYDVLNLDGPRDAKGDRIVDANVVAKFNE